MTDRGDRGAAPVDNATQGRRLAQALTALDPAESALARMENSIDAAFESEQRSLVAEWIDLLRVDTPLNASYALAATLGMIVVTPFGLYLLTALATA